ncbi:SDR family NAD(P)-dependent oxidoreductase [Salinicoccus carnicancri]|uniref:SDR family NAD(P)-dependent oxidoreductase n=1 Tax=Salinicoccus carnicancri TaxID=558170 RepID=UPI0002FC5858|nr:SDR family oxidoreductase [Salinicoccus carnicancri]
MTNKIVLITGGAGGIGQAIAKEHLDNGNTVVLVDLKEDSLNIAKENLGGNNIEIIVGDVTDEGDVKNYVDKTVEKFSRVDIFYNNAGVNGPFKPIKDLDKNEFEKIMAINTTGVFLGLKFVLPQMEKQGFGNVVNTASNAAYIGSAGMPGYIASKHAVAGLTKTAALEVGDKNIRVNAIAPAAIDTDMLTDIRNNLSPGEPEKSGEALKQGIPFGRFGTPAEVAKVAYFLGSEDASFVTGSLYNVDGGMQAD